MSLEAKSRTVLRTNVGKTKYRIDKRQLEDPEEGLIKKYVVVEVVGDQKIDRIFVNTFGDAVYEMFKYEWNKTPSKPQLNLVG